MAKKRDLPTGPGGKPPLPSMKGGLRAYISDVAKEMKKVVWPNASETVRLTTSVLLVCLLFVLYLWAAGQVVDIFIRLAEGKGI